MAKIAIYGAGAVGSVMAAKLARAGHQVSVIARGAHLQAIREHGLQYSAGYDTFTVDVTASDNAAELGVQDVVICTLKAHTVAASALSMRALLAQDTPVIFAQNGLPWWYFSGQNVSVADIDLDPHGVLARYIGLPRTVGCIIHCPSQLVSPGVVKQHGEAACYYLGEPGGDVSARLLKLQSMLSPALPVTVVPDIRFEVWRKLRINMTSSLLTTLTLSLPADIMKNQTLRLLARQVLAEVVAIAAAYDVRLPPDEEDVLLNLSQSLHAPSMLQDLLAARPLEIDAQLISVQQMARAAGVSTPTLDGLLALVLQRLTATARHTSAVAPPTT
ncbi:ketopantoate reductase family protein [Pantoea sp. App145]|uniref:ketopantoate reductase family protein n=1 Tax=Pantoea sp. App145 TaxID=3071567 RepID=UPI003A812084